MCPDLGPHPLRPAQGRQDRLRRRQAARSARTSPCRRSWRPAPDGPGPPTVAHSLTLAVATLGYASAPLLPLNAAIALSILFLGPEIVRAGRGDTSLTLRHPWVVAFAFGLLHGFGFASGLTSMGLPRAEIPIALLLFNLGVEAGQMLFVLLIVLLERAFRTLEMR